MDSVSSAFRPASNSTSTRGSTALGGTLRASSPVPRSKNAPPIHEKQVTSGGGSEDPLVVWNGVPQTTPRRCATLVREMHSTEGQEKRPAAGQGLGSVRIALAGRLCGALPLLRLVRSGVDRLSPGSLRRSSGGGVRVGQLVVSGRGDGVASEVFEYPVDASGEHRTAHPSHIPATTEKVHSGRTGCCCAQTCASQRPISSGGSGWPPRAAPEGGRTTTKGVGRCRKSPRPLPRLTTRLPA